MKQKDFSQLTSLDLLDLAIWAEEEAADRYGEFADQMELHHNVRAVEFFRKMQAREVEHFGRLQEERKRRSDLPAAIEPLQFSDPIETPSYENSHYKMTPTHVFHMTLDAERRAVVFYKKLADILLDPEARDMARNLTEEEARHVEWVEEELTKLPPIPVDWDEDHDEPTSQD